MQTTLHVTVFDQNPYAEQTKEVDRFTAIQILIYKDVLVTVVRE